MRRSQHRIPMHYLKGKYPMDTLLLPFYVIVGLFGLVVGSFCNVCILRIPLGEGVVVKSSHCMNCQKRLRFWELVPLFSYLFLRGKCSACGYKISPQYPIVEAVNAALWVVVSLNFGLSYDTLLGCLLTSALLVLSVIDLRTREIPPSTTIFIAILGGARLALNLSQWQSHLIGGVSVAGFLMLLLLLSGGRAIGGGDVKLMAGCGLFLGLWNTLLAFMLGCVVGSVVHIIRMKFFGAGRDLAMGPYLALGVWVAFLWGDNLINMYIKSLGI